MNSIYIGDIIAFVIDKFQDVVIFTFDTLDSFKISTNFSVLDLMILITIMLAVIPLLLSNSDLRKDKGSTTSYKPRKEKEK